MESYQGKGSRATPDPGPHARKLGTTVPPPTADLRLSFFADWARAVDARDVSAMKKASQALRSLRVSVLLLAPTPGRRARP